MQPAPLTGTVTVDMEDLYLNGDDAARTPHGDSNVRGQSGYTRVYDKRDAARTPHGDSNPLRLSHHRLLL